MERSWLGQYAPGVPEQIALLFAHGLCPLTPVLMNEIRAIAIKLHQPVDKHAEFARYVRVRRIEY
jgi:hypothetical protein